MFVALKKIICYNKNTNTDVKQNKKTSRSGQTLLEVFCILELASYGLVAFIFSLITI